MFFYFVHRLAFDIPATYFGLRGFDGLGVTYGAAAVNAGFAVSGVPLLSLYEDGVRALGLEVPLTARSCCFSPHVHSSSEPNNDTD
jgi:hypothetical protein